MTRRLLPDAPRPAAALLPVGVLAPLLDLLTLLLVMLLRAWGPPPPPTPEGLHLATAAGQPLPAGAWVLTATREGVRAEGVWLWRWEQGTAAPLDGVYPWCLRAPPGGPVVVAADAGLSMEALGALIETARAAGIKEILLAGAAPLEP